MCRFFTVMIVLARQAYTSPYFKMAKESDRETGPGCSYKFVIGNLIENVHKVTNHSK
jgi:hypothetical protein